MTDQKPTPEPCPWCGAEPFAKMTKKRILGGPQLHSVSVIECINVFCPHNPKMSMYMRLDELIKAWNAAIAENRARGVFPELKNERVGR